MTYEEQTILDFLAASPETYFARKEIARKAAAARWGKKKEKE
jgi:hypothetical protein